MMNKPMYNTETFTDVFSNPTDFVASYNNNGIKTTIKEENVTLLYWLLYARYGNSPISNFDVNQFKVKLFAIVFQYGPTWETRLKIQERFRELNEEELRTGSKVIYNRAYNDGGSPSTATLEEILTVNEQTSNNNKRSIIEAYATLEEVLKSDVTEMFISKFKYLFKQFVMPENPILYVSEEED